MKLDLADPLEVVKELTPLHLLAHVLVLPVTVVVFLQLLAHLTEDVHPPTATLVLDLAVPIQSLTIALLTQALVTTRH